MENILLLVVSILALVGLILIAIAIYKSNELIDKENKIADFYRRKYEQEHAEKEEYKKLRLQEVHNNTILVSKNRALTKAIKELEKLSKMQQYNSVRNLQNKMQSIIKELFTDTTQDK